MVLGLNQLLCMIQIIIHYGAEMNPTVNGFVKMIYLGKERGQNVRMTEPAFHSDWLTKPHFDVRRFFKSVFMLTRGTWRFEGARACSPGL